MQTSSRLRESQNPNDDQPNIRWVNVPDDGSCLFWSTALAYLIPVKDNDGLFSQRYDSLFGAELLQHLNHVRSLIHNNDVYNNVLAGLIRNNFRRRVVDYIRNNRESFEDFIDNNEPFNDYLDSMRNPETWGGEPEIRAISEMLEARITVYSGAVMTYGDGNVQINLCHVGPQDQRNHYNFGLERRLIDHNAVQSLEESLNKYHQSNMLLHIAVSEVNKELVRLLLSEEAEVNIENNDGKTPVDIAKQSNKEKIIKTLEEHLKKSFDQIKRLSKQEKEVHEKLIKFVEDFVFIYERSLSEYYERLEGQKRKPGKYASFINKIIMDLERSETKASSLGIISVLKIIASGIGVKHNRANLKKLIDQLYIFKMNPVKVREELVKSGVEIFQSFESQFVQVIADGSWQRAMTKLAEDAVSRVVDYYRKNSEKEFCTNSITKGIVLGESKKYKQISTDVPHIKPGHTLESKSSNLWNTAELFDKAGLVTIKSDGSPDKYYKRIDGKSDTSKYGYRLLFKWELENKIKKFVKEYSEEKTPREEYRYVLKSDGKTNEKWQGELLDKLNKQDPKLVEDRLLRDFKEGMAQEAEKNFNELENFIDKNFNELSSYVESNQDEIKRVFSKLISQHQQTTQQQHKIANFIVEGRKKSEESFKEVFQKLDKIDAVVAGQQVKGTIWFDVKKPVSLFTGREEKLIELHQKIHRSSKKVTLISQITSISGLGGIGKTQLAREYIQEYSKNYYDNVIWINGESEVALIESFTRLAKDKLKIDTKDANGKEKDIRSIVEEVYNFFSNSKSLFIFDDAEESNYLNKFLPLHDSLPDGNEPYILITSRNLEWDKGIEIINLNELKPEEAIEFVKKGLSIEDESQNEKIEALVEKLKHFPLAIQQAIAYIEDQRVTGEFDIDDYLNEYEKKTKDLLNYEAFKGIDNDYAKTTFTTWKMTIDKIANNEKYGNLALRILDVISYLAPEKIRREVFLGLTGSSEEELRSAVRLLVKYSMVNGEQRQSVLSTHKLVQEVTRIELKEEGKSEEVMEDTFELLRASFPYASNKLEDHLKKRQLLPHLEEFLSHIDNWLKKNPKNKEKIEKGYLKNLLIWMSYGYFSLFNPKRQRELLERALPILEEHYGENHFEVAKTLLSLSISYGDLDDYQKQKESLERALPILENHYGENNFRVGIIQVNLGNVYLILDDNQKAKELLKRALPILENHYGENNFKVAKTLVNLSIAYRALGDYQRAKELTERALPILEKHYGEDHFEVAIALENLAFAEKALVNHQRATELLERADKIYRKGKVEECLPSTSLGRRKREVKIGECELSWEDVDKFNTEKDEKRDFSKIKIDSEKFVNYIKDLPEEKHSQLIELAGKVQVKGRFSNLVDKLTSNQKVMNHLSRVKKISSITTHGMMVKNVLAGAVNGNYQGVAINVGFIAGGKGFAQVAEAASLKGLNLLSEGKALLGRSLRVASPFLARGTSAFVIYDLVNQIKAFKNSTEEALVGVIGDSIYLGVDSAEIGIEVAEVFEVLEGVSSVTGPIGAGIGAVVFVGTDVYSAIERVNRINKMVHLSTEEELLEFTRAFFKMEPEASIQELAEEVSIYKKLVNHAIQYLENNNRIQRYVFSTGKLTVKECKEIDVTFLPQLPPGLILSSSILSSPRTKQEKCTTEFQEDLNNIIILSHQEKYNHFCSLDTNALNSDRILCSPAKSLIPLGEDKLIRVFYPNKETRFIKYLSSIRQTDHNKVASVLAYPKRECGSYKDISTLSMIGMASVFARQFELNKGYEYMDEQPSYLCHNAIGIEYTHNRKGNYTLIQLENGNDIAIGFRESPNIFISKNGNKTITGGDKEDIFIFIGNYTTGSIDGMAGENTLDLSEFAPQENVINLNGNNIKSSNTSIAMQNITKILGRRNKADNINCTCDMNYVNGQGGKDVVTIKDYGCFYKLNLVVKERNTVLNEGRGNFSYFIAPSKQQGQALIIFPSHSESNHTITLNYTLSDIDRIDVQSTNRTKFYISLFNLTIENTKNPTQYLFSNESRLEIYNKNNIYIFHKISEAIEEVVTDYSNIANKLGAYIFIQSKLNNETALIGHRNHDVLYSDPYHTSHLIGNGGENIFVVTPDLTNKLPIPEVVLYDVDQENKIDTLDLRQIRKQVESGLNVKVKIRIIISDKDLIIQLFYENKVSEINIVQVSFNIVQVRLKNSLLTNWYERLHVIMNHVPIKIEEFELRPLPLVFDNNEEIIRIAAEDVDKNNKIIISQKIEDYTFSKLGNDLIMTFNHNASLILSEFYTNKGMETLTIRFANKEVAIKDELNNVRSFDDLREEYRNNTANIINNFNSTEASNSTEISVEPLRRSKRDIESNLKSAASRPTSFINTIASTVTNAMMSVIQGVSQFISAEKHSTSQQHVQISDTNSTLLLLDVFIRKITGEKYISLAEQSISPSQARDYALSITDSFEKVLAKSSGCAIPKDKLDFDWFNKLFRSIEGSMISGQYSKVPRILHESAKNICSNPSEKFFSDVERNIEKMLNDISLEKRSTINSSTPLSSLSSIDIEPVNRRRAIG